MSISRNFSDGRGQGKAMERPSFVQTCNLLSQYIKEKGSLRDLNLEIGGKVESLEAIVKPGSSLSASASASASASTFVNLPTDTGKSAPNSSRCLASGESSIIIVEDGSNKASTSKEGTATTSQSKPSQLTIFYSGRVLVFDEYPVEKVRELVSIAKRNSSQMSYGIVSNTLQEKTKNPNGPSAASASSAREGLPPRPQPASGKQPIGISPNSCKEKRVSCTATNGGDVASSSRAQEELSPPSEANGSDMPIARRSSLHRFLEKRKDRAAVRGPYQHQDHAPGPSHKDEEQLDLNK